MSTSILDDPDLAILVDLALREDGVARDLTSLGLVPEAARARGRVVARDEGTIAGMPLVAAASPLMAAFPKVEIHGALPDGSRVHRGDVVVELRGPARDVLGLERTLLNFLQRLSGIATRTAAFVATAGPHAVRIQETRKTCPGWRRLDKYAVQIGGGLNHRQSLSDQVLIKENHLVFMGGRRDPESVLRAVRQARDQAGEGILVEVEVEGLDQLDAALEAEADIIMLDEFSDADIAEAVRRKRDRGASALLEVSGGVGLARISGLAALGVDRISVGALTHSVVALDLAMEIVAEAASS